MTLRKRRKLEDLSIIVPLYIEKGKFYKKIKIASNHDNTNNKVKLLFIIFSGILILIMTTYDIYNDLFYIFKYIKSN